MSPVIETKNLTKKFGKFIAVDNVSLKVNKGEIYGFLGLNGAGKTTTIRMMLGLIAPSQGSVRITGKPILRGGHGPWEKIGCLVEIPYSYPDLTVKENLDIYRRLRGIKDASASDKIMDLLKLTQYKDRKAGHLSLGNSQRLGLAKALIHNPDILILDEPSNGLDPAGIVEIRELLLDLAHNIGVTVFISSHILGEISKIADRIGIIHQGRLKQEMNAADLEANLMKKLIINTGDNEKALHVLTENGLSPSVNCDNNIELCDIESLSRPDRVNILLVSKSVSPLMLYTDTEDLEEYFLRIIKSGEVRNE